MKSGNAWRGVRTVLLGVILLSVVTALLRLILFPPSERKMSYSFPDQVPLAGWSVLDGMVREVAPESSVVIAQRSYRYGQHDLRLDVRVIYLADSDGNLRANLPEGIVKAPVFTTRKNREAGSFSLWSSESHLFLSAFISPQGSSTVTETQFRSLRYRHDITPGRLLRWLIGRASLRDNRCMLVHMALPLNANSSEAAASALEDAWASWFDWWQPRFPEI